MFIYENGKKKIVVGTVESVVPVTFKGETKTAVKVVDRAGETVTVLFSGTMVDRVEKAKMREGAFVSILCEMVTKDAGNGLEFKYKGWWYLDSEYNGTPTKVNIFMSTITSPKRISEKCFEVSMPIDKYNKETKSNETQWVHIRFAKNADLAEKLLGKGNHYGVITCSSRQVNKSKEGKEYPFYYGNAIELRLDSNKEA